MSTKAEVERVTEFLQSYVLSPQVFPSTCPLMRRVLQRSQAWERLGFDIQLNGIMRRYVELDYTSEYS